jgi:hypothetical protein
MRRKLNVCRICKINQNTKPLLTVTKEIQTYLEKKLEKILKEQNSTCWDLNHDVGTRKCNAVTTTPLANLLKAFAKNHFFIFQRYEFEYQLFKKSLFK